MSRSAHPTWWVAGALVMLAGCSTPAPSTGVSSVSAQSSAVTDIISTVTGAGAAHEAGLVDIGGGRKIFLECRGTGSPTVVLIGGKGSPAQIWNEVLEPADPIRKDPYDQLSAGAGTLITDATAVLPSVSGFTRVCAYDRPGTSDPGPLESTPRPQPHTVDLDVEDLHALLAAAGEPAPFVLVAHSYGGLIAELYAGIFPKEVAGLVMVDAATSRYRQATTPETLAAWDAMHRGTLPEGVEIVDAFDRIDAAGPLPDVPAVVLSADKPLPPELVPPEIPDFTAIWSQAQALGAAYLHAPQMTETDSGHVISAYSPDIVVDAIRGVVEADRTAGSGTTGP